MRRLMLSVLAGFGIVASAGCGTSVQVDPGFVILDTSPSGGAVNVSTEVELFVVMSQAVDATTTTSVTLVDANGAAVDAGVAPLSDPNVLSITPSSPLNPGAAYVLKIASTLKSTAGEDLGADVEKRFLTAP